jgi:hypothetical protein
MLFTGYACVFGHVDNQLDMVVQGAFEGTLKELGAHPLPLLWSHDETEQIGWITHFRETEYGLYIEGEIWEHTVRNTTLSKRLKSKKVKGLSIGYKVRDYTLDISGVRIITRLDLYEISIVMYPANTMATIVKCSI